MERTELLRILVETLERLELRYFVTGSTATTLFGDPRLTNDIDVVVDLKTEQIAAMLAAFPPPEYYVSESAMREAVTRYRQFNIIHPASGFKIDVIVPKETPFNRSRLSRALTLPTGGGFEASFSSPEDVIVKKLDFYREGGSEKHLRDIAGVIRVRKDALDVRYIEEWVDKLGLAEEWRILHERMREESEP